MFISRNFFLAGGGPNSYSVIYPFTASGSWIAPAGVTTIDYLAVAGGGGGGGSPGGGGGGAGGYQAGTAYTVTPGLTYNITVGGGGPTQTVGGNTSILYNTNYNYSFNGTTQYLSTNYSLNWSTGGSYTLEFWINLPSLTANQTFFTTGNAASGTTGFYTYSTGSVGLGIFGVNEITTATGILTANTWNHIAYTYNGTTTTIYVNGVSRASSTTAVYANNSGNFVIGGGGGVGGMTGYLSNIRLSKLVVYTGAFTVPTSPLTATQSAGTNISAITGTQTALLTLQNATIIDNSTFAYTITNNGSVIASQNTTPFTTGITVNGGGYGAVGGIATNVGGAGGSGGGGGSGPSSGVTGSAGGSGTAGQGYAGGAGSQVGGSHQMGGGGGGAGGVGGPSTTAGSGPAGDGGLSIASTISGTTVYYAGGGGGGGHYTGTTRGGYGGGVTPARSGGDGANKDTAGTTGTTNTGGGGGGAGNSGTSGMAGGSGIVILAYKLPKNTAFTYTSSGVFRAPITSSTANYLVVAGGGGGGTWIGGGGGAGGFRSGTALALTANTVSTVTVGAGGVGSSNRSNAGTNGTNSELVPNNSYSFNGSSQYLTVAANAVLDFGTGDFTIECWVYSTSVANNYPTFVGSVTGWSAGASGHRFSNIGVANKFSFHLNGAGDPFLTSTNTFSFSTWYHYALTRSGNTWKMYINGSLEATGTYTGSYNLGLGGARIGFSAWDGANGYYKGNVSNLRVVKGVAVYTGVFTPPTSPLTATQSAGTNISAITGTQTSLLTLQNDTIVDNSTNAFTITNTGTVPLISNTPFTITSTGGGGGGSFSGSNTYVVAGNGGSGGGSASTGAASGGTGNTPSTSPSQGNNGGGNSGNGSSGGGGGGAGAVGGAGGATVGAGGVGTVWNGAYYAGGGGGALNNTGTGGVGGAGGGGNGSSNSVLTSGAGTANTGGGGGGGANDAVSTLRAGGTGGSGVVIIKLT